jgi:ATP-dependent DNA helicase RecQ
MVDVMESLRRHFGHPAFRLGQEDVVRTVLKGRDVLAVMPTGSGKSLGFQLPAVLLPGTTLVVSPLIALMKDQVDELRRRGIRAAALHSLVAPEARRAALEAARAGTLQLLYVAPERFASSAFLRLLEALPVARFVVDEAHCVSEWGHDFRPDYRRLREAAALCRRADGHPGRPPLGAFTATATPEVRADVVQLLGLADPCVIVAGFDRPNIHPAVRPVSNEAEKQRLLPGLVGDRRALVYTATRARAETAAAVLHAAGIDAAAYHGGMVDAARTRVQDRFASGALRVVCATNAFGMGIDRPDVEAVIHADLPGSIEAYYQEIGRAGRDGPPGHGDPAVDVCRRADPRVPDRPRARGRPSAGACPPKPRRRRARGHRSRGARTPEDARAREIAPDDRVCGNRRLPARDHPALLRRSGGE